jgi:hypothetical protein
MLLVYDPGGLTFCVNELRVKVNPTVPFNSVECDSDPLESIMVLNPLKDAEVQILLHVQDAVLAVIEDYRKHMVGTGHHFLY